MPDEVENDTDWGPALSEQFAKADAGGDNARDGSGTAVPTAGDVAGIPGVAADSQSDDGDSAADRARDDSGRFVAKKPGAASKGNEAPRASGSGAQAGAASGAPTAAAAPPGAAPVVPPAPVLPEPKPPQSWKPALREKWTALPPEVREQIVQRERETDLALMKAKKEGELADSFREVVRPYEAQFRQVGVPPQQYVGDLLRTAHALTYSSPQQKAEIAAGIVMQFGVTPQDLDAALVARMNGRPQQQQQQAPQQFRDPRVDQLVRGLQERENAVITQRSEKFAESHEHFEDVADEMVSLLEAWKLQGKDHSSDQAMEKAYGIACNSNESVAQVVMKQKAAAAAANAQASTQRAKAAASSVRSTPGGGGNASPDDKEDEWGLNSSWDRAAASR